MSVAFRISFFEENLLLPYTLCVYLSDFDTHIDCSLHTRLGNPYSCHVRTYRLYIPHREYNIPHREYKVISRCLNQQGIFHPFELETYMFGERLCQMVLYCSSEHISRHRLIYIPRHAELLCSDSEWHDESTREFSASALSC